MIVNDGKDVKFTLSTSNSKLDLNKDVTIQYMWYNSNGKKWSKSTEAGNDKAEMVVSSTNYNSLKYQVVVTAKEGSAYSGSVTVTAN